MPWEYVGSGAYHEVYRKEDVIFKRRKGMPLIVCKNKEQLEQLKKASNDVRDCLGFAFVWCYETNETYLSLEDDDETITDHATLNALTPFIKKKLDELETIINTSPIHIGTTSYTICFEDPKNNRPLKTQRVYNALKNTVYSSQNQANKMDVSQQDLSTLNARLFQTIAQNPLIYVGTEPFDTYSRSMPNCTSYDELIESMNSPERTQKLLNECNTTDLHPQITNVPELGGKGVQALFIKGEVPTDMELSLFVRQVFQKTGRILIDAMVEGNVIKTLLGLVCVDPNFALSSPTRHQRTPSDTSAVYFNTESKRKEIEEFLQQPNSYPITTAFIQQLFKEDSPKPSYSFFNQKNTPTNQHYLGGDQPNLCHSPNAHFFLK